ncbi:putative NurA nuclease [Candidatus Nitrosocosmicus arcticus]|uniref:Putative NurA nuclease n=1 Tax=Candidatus Nitrosocosmicus arcticus TaxID=2035267 RepID=A0A557SY43_9ARCH|nr:putative NurA nuclease [Candidatus Nitrosocosmicus arcticus]
MLELSRVLLPDLYLDAIKNKEKKLSSIHGDEFDDLLKIASTKWVEYEPVKKPSFSVGVDSSWNKKSFQGIDLFVIDSVAVSSHNQVLGSKWDYGISNITGDSLSAKAMKMEIDLTKCVLDQKPDYVCVDGSIISNLIHNKNVSYRENVQSLFGNDQKSDVLFISKNSTSKNQFKEFGSRAADIYYYNKLGYKTGFSLANKNNFISDTLAVVEIYARLTAYVPLIKIEIINRTHITKPEIQNLVDGLCYHSIKGYPYCLKLAHQSCKITNNDVKRLASLYGFKNEFGSRDSLNE